MLAVAWFSPAGELVPAGGHCIRFTRSPDGHVGGLLSCCEWLEVLSHRRDDRGCVHASDADGDGMLSLLMTDRAGIPAIPASDC
jgi:hypothetical protein